MVRLAAFADEISPDLTEQIRVCREHGITHIELRSAGGVNVLDFTPAARLEIRDRLAAAGIGVAAIGSPIGKVALDRPWPEHFDRFKIAVELAQFFEAPLIRLFSYYPPGGEGKGAMEPHRGEVLERFHQKVNYVRDLPVTLVHENEKGIYGDIGRRCLDLMTSINSPKLRAAFDFANFVQCGEDPLDVWPALKPFVVHIHIKDALRASGTVVPAGQGDGHLEPILKDACAGGYRGFLSLEPHLKVAGHSHGETGPELFAVAVRALKEIC
ncbi:MAG: sugar phosphate isomerase/epimerase, partial [Phycisphaerae bacterium]|nr:sugar phosphate isomerase/epimerase [Phycisphaerae bacterium]